MRIIRVITQRVMPILGKGKRSDRDRGSSIQHSALSPTKSPANKIPRSRKNLYEVSNKNVELEDKEMEKILQELQVIKQGQTEIKESQNKILERVGAVESELNNLKTEVEGVKVNQANVNAKVNLFEKSVRGLNFEINRLEQYSRKSSVRIYGIHEEEGEKVTEKVINTIKEEIGVKLEAEEIDITHRVGQRRQDRGRGILVKFVSHKSKVKIMKKKRQAKNIRVSEDLAQGTRKC